MSHARVHSPLRAESLFGLMKTAFRFLAPLMAIALPTAAIGAPGGSASTSGSAQAEVVAPSQIQRLEDLRFGAILQPATSGTLIISPDGTETFAGGVVGSTGVVQPPAGRGPGSFKIDGQGLRHFQVKISKSIAITSGAATMLVNNFQTNVPNGNNVFGTTGTFELHVGGTLNVGANQQTGSYSGTFDVTVTYL